MYAPGVRRQTRQTEGRTKSKRGRQSEIQARFQGRGADTNQLQTEAHLDLLSFRLVWENGTEACKRHERHTVLVVLLAVHGVKQAVLTRHPPPDKLNSHPI
ncbi:uncharacterized protein UMAG_05707 [Mycosarcoma maydis]|uniref:Uncharacterized protein n=1 Tax=Mycosarcoma maydis TaxID=5270 RepID=A0A0D1CJ23_MYCMD|nr:uncharacterized protein UMAG_05707 [Ustilago maydis 521]KIS66923.1 hypothetical protein UMAG_05707 [Ustilago maydis 521]|eukprot:XP_011391461.1 hypothetical protein UMAG_05707 [Ustilago maydis 521]